MRLSTIVHSHTAHTRPDATELTMTTHGISIALLLAASFVGAQTVDYTLVAAPGSTTVAPGIVIPALLYNNQLPAPVLSVTQGQTLRVRFINALPEPSSLHWHGLSLPGGMDGVIGVSRPAVAPGQEFIYEFPCTHSGTYWFHPHVEDQMTSGLYGTLIVHPANPAADPQFDLDETVMLHDFTTAAGGGLMGNGAAGFAGHLLNGRTSAGQTPITVQTGQRLRLRFVNAAATNSYIVALDGHLLEVTHADGHRVLPITSAAIPIGPGERYDAIVTLNNPGTWSLAVSDINNRAALVNRAVVQYAGSTVPVPPQSFVPPNLATGALLTYNQLAAFAPQGAITSTPNRTYNLALAMTMSSGSGGMMMSFTINGQAWPNVTPFAVNAMETVQLNLANTSMGSMDHPMHIHGHFWKLMGTAGGISAPPIKDTVLIRAAGQQWGSASVQFVADNPGEWALHCHNADHMMRGMMNTLQYGGDADGDGIATSVDWDPLSIHPVLTIPESAPAFAIGGSGSLSVQAAAGSTAFFFIGSPLVSPIALPPLGTVWIDPPTLLGSAVAAANQDASINYAIPNAPVLSGLRIGIQALAWVPFAPGSLLSTWQPFTIY